MIPSEVRLQVYRRFLETGRAPAPGELAALFNVEVAAIEHALRELEAQRALVLAPTTSTIWMAHPFSAVPTAHRVVSNGRGWWANCAWDALGVASLLEADSIIRSRCDDCADPIEVIVRKGSASGDAVIHMAVPPRKFWENVAYT